MALRRIIELAHAQIEVEERSGYLYVVESGQLRDLRELSGYTSAMDELVAKCGIDKAIIDARGEVGDPPAEVRNGMWDWLMAPDRGFALVAFILPSEMAVARVNMTALSRRAPVRAFESVQDAQRWLTRGPKASSVMGMSAAVRSSSRISSRPPAPVSEPAALAPTERPPAGASAPPAMPPIPSAPRPPSGQRTSTVSKRPSDPGVDGRTRPSDRGFRPPEPGPSERPARSKLQAQSDRPTRESDVRSREDDERARSGGPPKGGGANGGSQVA